MPANTEMLDRLELKTSLMVLNQRNDLQSSINKFKIEITEGAVMIDDRS